MAGELRRHLDSQPCLADAARADQRHQPPRAEQLDEGRHVGGPSDDRRSSRPLVGNELADEPVAAPANVADEALLRPIVADRPPDLLDPGGERGLRDEPIAPHLVEQLLLGHDPLAMRQQVGEHVERARLEVLHSPLTADFAGGHIDSAVAETDHPTESRVAERPGHPSANPQATTKRLPDVGASNRRMPTNQTDTPPSGPTVVEPSESPVSLDTRLFEAAIASLELHSVHLGRRLGLYDALRDAGEATVDELATRAAIAPRYAREWLEQQAVAGFITVDDPDADAAIRRFRLNDEQQAVFVEPDHPAHISPVADMIAGIGHALDDVADAYRRGTGVVYKDYGPHLRHGQGGINRPAYTSALADWLDATQIGQRLRNTGPGVRIADVGCGQGWSTIALAATYPQADIVGFDDDTASIEDARRHAAAAGVDVTFEALGATAVADRGPFDAVIVLETLHDIARPIDALLAWRRALARGGAVVIADEKVAERFTAPGDETERFMYGFSVLHCLPSSMAAPDSAALGTVLRAATVHELTAAAGFDRCAEIDVDAGFFRIYELTPEHPHPSTNPTHQEHIMTTTTATTAFVAAHPDTVFELLVDVDRLPEWNEIITRVLHRPAVIEPGAEWLVEMHAMGQTWPSRTRVEAIDRTERRLVYRSGTDDANPSFTTWHWHVQTDPHGSQVTVAWDLNPRTFWRRHLVVHLRRRALAREVPASIRAIEAAARRQPALAVS